jgi:hypothetical protein
MVLKVLGGRPDRDTTGHLQISVFRLHAPSARGDHNACVHQVQDGINKSRSGNKDWEFVSMGTEISRGKYVPEYFTPLTLNLQTSVVSTEETDAIWETTKKVVK